MSDIKDPSVDAEATAGDVVIQESESNVTKHLSPRSDNVTQNKKDQKNNDIKPAAVVEVKSKENVSENEERKTVQRSTVLRKRSYSFSDGSIKHPSLPPVKRWKLGSGRGGGRGRGLGPNSRPGAGPGFKNVLPSKFLLGGSYNDPLNLNSLNDERISRVVNAVTPESSPLPTPVHRKEEYKIEVLIPPNMNDPLNLNAEDDSDYEAKLISPLVKRKKIRHRKRPRKVISNVETDKTEQHEEGNEGDISDNTDEEEPTASTSNNKKPAVAEVKEIQRQESTSKPVQKNNNQKEAEVKGEPSKLKEKNKFQYGNYNQYYGYRNPGNIEDLRLQYFKSAWFEDKEVLDIGCNIGHITISIAKNYSPLRAVGVDIDKKLIEIASKNIRHYADTR